MAESGRTGDTTLLWIGCGGCSGETQALLGVEGQASDLVDMIDVDGLRIWWHPSLADQDLWSVYRDVMAGREELTVLCVEGSIALAEDGMFDIAGDEGKFRIVRSLCERADYVVAMGACAGYGGWQAPLARGAAAERLVQRARAWAERHTDRGDAASRPARGAGRDGAPHAHITRHARG